MKLRCQATTTHNPCKKFHTYFDDLNMLPYNSHNPENSVWWLTTSSELASALKKIPNFKLYLDRLGAGNLIHDDK